MPDPHRLQRFVDAQDSGQTYDLAVAELRSGRKRGHWMWFVFPQIAGLGHSPMSRTFAISSLGEAQAYLAHPILGARLADATHVVSELSGHTAQDIFGGIDAIKLRSSMTLFARADPGNPLFAGVLDTFFGGVPDDATDRLLSARGSDAHPG
ncbi:MAG: DUF1810 domain-containing protein [Solirubrobacteraceae bacterium]